MNTLPHPIPATPYEVGPPAPAGAVGTEEQPFLTRYLQIAWRRKFLIGTIVALALAISILATLMATRLFTASATIEISRQEENIVQVDSVQPEVTGIDQEFYQTQYSLLQSESQIERVIDDLNLVSNSRFIEAMDIRVDGEGVFADIDPSRMTPEQRAELRREIGEALEENVVIAPTRGSRIVEVAFTSPDPQLSAEIANAWVQAFIRSNFDRKLESSAFATSYLQEQLEELRRRLEASERDLVDYATSNRIITVQPPAGMDGDGAQAGSISDANLTALNRAFAAAKAKRIAAESRLRDGTSNESLNNATLSELRQERASAAAQYAQLLTMFEPEFPEARALRSRIEELDAAIGREENRVRRNLQTNYQEALAEERRLASAVGGLEQENLDLRRRGIQYNIYQREVDTNRELYDGLLQRFKEVGLAAGIGPNNIAIVDVARPPLDPSSPNLLSNLLFGLLAGVAFSGLAIFIAEQFDQKLRVPADVEKAVPYPVLGAIPESDGDALAEMFDRKSSMAEAYMSVQTALRLATDHGVPRSLMVTSTRPGEGKSLTSLALARSLAHSGRSVIILDADLRSPSLHKELEIDNAYGLSDYLTGQDDWQALTLRTELPKLKAMTTGAIPPNPAELLISGRLERLITELGQSFDHVLLDCPPVLGLADAPLIAEKVEGTLYVVEAGALGSQALRRSIGRLQMNAKRIVGIVMTKFTGGPSLFGYSTEYGYSYTYSDDEDLEDDKVLS